MKFRLLEEHSKNFSNNIDTEMIKNLDSSIVLPIPNNRTKCSTSAVYVIKELVKAGEPFKLCFGQIRPFNNPEMKINHVWIEYNNKVIQTNNPWQTVYPQYYREVSSIEEVINFIKELQ